jgi:hypothetical protein
VENLEHLRDVALNDPLGNYITYGLANEALGDGFMFVDSGGEEIMQNVQKEMRVLKVKEVMIQALAYERTYGYSYIYTGKNRYVPKTPEGARLAKLHAFTPEECKVRTYTGTGDPLSMEVTVSVGQGEGQIQDKKIVLPAEDFIFMNTRPLGRGYKGQSALAPVWDALTFLRYIYWGMAFYDMKIGAGMLYAKTKGGIPDELISKLNASLEDWSISRSWVVDGGKIEEVGYLSPGAGTTDFEKHIHACLQLVAAGSGIPLDNIIGAASGSHDSLGANQKAGFKKIAEVQGDTEPYWKEVVTRMGYNNKDYGFLWNARYAHDEEEQSKIDMNNAQSNTVKLAYMTIDEVREENGLPPLPEGRGDRLSSEVSQFNIGVQGLQGPDEEEKTKNPEGRQL